MPEPASRSTPTNANRLPFAFLADSTTFSAASRNTSVPNLETPGTGSISDRRATPGLLIPKNRSAGNLAAHASNSSPYSAQSQRARLSVDAGVDYDLARCVQTAGADMSGIIPCLRRLHGPCTANKSAECGGRMTAGTRHARDTIADAHLRCKQVTHPNRRARHRSPAHQAGAQSLLAEHSRLRAPHALDASRDLAEVLHEPPVRAGVASAALQRRSDSISFGIPAFVLVCPQQQRHPAKPAASPQAEYRVHAGQAGLGFFVASHCECAG